jgi:hypothetical protein
MTLLSGRSHCLFINIGIWLCFELFCVFKLFALYTVFVFICLCYYLRYRINVLCCAGVCLAVYSPLVKLGNFLGGRICALTALYPIEVQFCLEARHPGPRTRIRIFSIPDPVSRVKKILGSRIRIKEFSSILTQKIVYKLSEI